MPSRRVDGMVGAAEGAGRVYWTGRPCLPPHDKVDFANRFQVDGQLGDNEQPASGRPDS